MFQIREKLKLGYVEMIQGMFATIDAAGENMNEIKFGQKQELERCINGFGKGFRKDLYDFFVTHVDQIRDLMLSPAKFNWYTHGDPIIENIMLKRNTEGVITGVAFIDFANVGLQSPLFDLFGFVYTSLKYDVEPPSMKDVQDVYKARLSECFPASELPGFASGEFYFTADDVLVSLCKVLRYFLDDNAWNKTDELLFRQLEPFWRVYFILKRREEKKLNEDVPGTVEALPS